MKVGRWQVIAGFALLALAAIPVFVPLPTGPGQPRSTAGPWSEERPGAIAVELSCSAGRDGIYFIPSGTTLTGFLELAGIPPSNPAPAAARPAVLRSATTVLLSTDSGGTRVEPMAMAKRLALGIPIDINRLSAPELRLVPGIGEKTAERILEHRASSGAFRRLEDLTQVKGIKEKRLEKLRPYLCVGC